jgi:hypothetical protein
LKKEGERLKVNALTANGSQIGCRRTKTKGAILCGFGLKILLKPDELL